MTPASPPPSQDEDSTSEDQAGSSQQTSTEGPSLSSEERPAPLESGGLASASNNKIDVIEWMSAMANKIGRKLFPCLFVLEEENVYKVAGVNYMEGPIEDISKYLDLIRQGEPTTGHDGHDCNLPESLVRLLTFLSTGRKDMTVASNFNDFSGAITVVKELLELIGKASYVTAGFLVVAYGLKRYQDVSDNKEECLSILEEMNNLNRPVMQCTERDKLKEGMQSEIEAATITIMEGSIKCLTQISSSPFSKFFKTSVNQVELSSIKEELKKKHERIYFKLQISMDYSNLKMPPNVKYMEIDGKLHCDNLEIFPTRLLPLQDLRILKLINFQGLKELPSALADLVKGLRQLTLSNCKSFKELPYSISKLKSLRVLRMHHCACVQKLPDDLGNLVSLVKLDLSNCESLNVLPDSFRELVSLRVLNLSSCKALEDLPDGLGKITSLRQLDLSHCHKLTEIPKNIGLLKKLRSIDISYCSNLTGLPIEFCELSITILKLTRCDGLKNLPNEFGNLQSLRILKLKSCTGLEKLPESFSKLKSLVHLNLSECSGLEELCKDFYRLLSLRTLSLYGCEKLERLPENFHLLSSLQHLNLINCEMLEGEVMHNVLKSESLEMVYIRNSDNLKKRWGEVAGRYPSWAFKVDAGQDLLEEEKENEWKNMSSNFDRLLQNGRGEQFQLSKLPLNTILLVMFDGQFDFNQDFPWPLIGETIEDIEINFEIVYIGKHFNKLPKTVANKITGRALDNADARIPIGKLFFTLKGNDVMSWHDAMNNFFSMSAKIVGEENGGKYPSCWRLLSNSQMEEFVLSKCRRYVWMKQLAAKTQESNIQLLRELFMHAGEDYRLYRKSVEVEIEELKDKTILLEIRPANVSFDIERLQYLKDLYESQRSDIEIISIPIGQPVKFEQFSADIPWLVLQNSWQMTRAGKYFLIDECQLEEGPWESSESWYPGRVRKIEPNGKIATYEPVLSMMQRWGLEVYPFTTEKINQLKKEEWIQRKSMSSLQFLFKPLHGELDKVKQRKMIGLLCDGKDPRTNRMRIKTFAGLIKGAMKDVIDSIHFIYVPHYDEKKKTVETVMDAISMAYFPMQDSKITELGLQHFSSLSQWAAMKFWMRVCDLRKEIQGMDENGKQLDGLRELLNSLDLRYRSLAFIDEDGEVLTTKGREIVGIFEKAKGPGEDEAKKLVADMIKGSPEERKEALRELDSRLT